jgi:macrolide transport system ATP-binding/permease protein
METLWKDLRYAVRVLAKSPGFSAVVILSLALAIGANTSIFSIVNAFLLRPMPVSDPDRLLAVYVTAPNGGPNIDGFSYPQWKDFTKQDTGLFDIVGSTGVPLSVTDGERPELIWGEIVTGNYFSGLGVHPIVGRGFLPDEDRNPGEKAVCVLNYSFWQRRFHGDPDIAGKHIQIKGHDFTIVGVAPHGFIGVTLFNFIPDLWVPVMMQTTIAPASPDMTQDRNNRWMSVRARMKPGVTPKQAEAALNVVARQLATEYPKTDSDLTVHVMAGGARTQPWAFANGMIPAITGIMGAVVLLVLLIACANVANLMLARGASRAREIGIRVAVGASRWRLMRQLMVESVILSLFGAVGGILFVGWFNDLSLRFYPTLDFNTMDISDTTRIDPRMFVFAFLLSLVAAVLFGLFPAFRATKIDQSSAMKGEQAAVRIGRFRVSPGNLLVMFQVALSCVLLVVGGLFLRSMQFAHSADIGMYRTGITMFSVNLDLQGYDEERQAKFERAMMERLRAIPGVDDAAYAFQLPMDAYGGPGPIYPEGWQPRSDREQNIALHTVAGSHYFNTMGVKLVAGRELDERDTAKSKLVAVINETMARRYWDSPERALGHRFALAKAGHEFEVVGVVRNGKYFSFGEPATSYVITAVTQDHPLLIEVLLRSNLDMAALMPAVRAEMTQLDPSLPLFGVRSMPQYLNRTSSLYEMGASLIGTFAIMAMVLAGVGIYGVLHFIVARRTREIGIRMALGARYAQVLRMVMGRSLAWVIAGLALGIGLALSAHSITGQMIAGVSGADPLTFAAAFLVFAAIVIAACVVPARRAAKVDPLHALRHD